MGYGMLAAIRSKMSSITLFVTSAILSTSSAKLDVLTMTAPIERAMATR
jgi:hypothetical protein